MPQSNIANLIVGKLGTALVFASVLFVVVSSPRNAFMDVVGFGSQMKMVGVAAACYITGMKNAHASWDVLFVSQNPRRSVGNSLALNAFSVRGFREQVDAWILAVGDWSFPQPAPTWRPDVDVRPKKPFPFWRKDLLKKLLRERFRSHRSVCLICATVPAASTARGHLYYNL